MPTWLSSLMSQHTVMVVAGCFFILSLTMSAIAGALTSIGDAVPGWIGTVSSWAGAAAHALNGNLPAASAAVSSTPVTPA